MARAKYFDYLKSDAWREVKRRYLRSARPKDCMVCGRPWDNSMVFHHRTYARLGREWLSDIRPVCKPCHDAIHKLQKTRRLRLSQASDPRRVRAFMRAAR
jgi:HNH endonuclease